MIVILDTDIGGDIDDTWALGMLLNSPELKTELVLTATADVAYRARLTCKFLEKCRRMDIPVGLGLHFPPDKENERQAEWVGDYSLDSYPGTVYKNGIQQALKIMEEYDEVTIIEIAPMSNLAEICRCRPDLVKKCHLVAMAGCIAKNFYDKDEVIAEFNVVQDLAAARTVWNSDWKSVTITPLDTCGSVQLTGELYKRIADSSLPIPRYIVENYKAWGKSIHWSNYTVSTLLYDTVAVHLALSHNYLDVEEMKLIIDEKGFMKQDSSGRKADVAIRWNDKEAYYRFLTEHLLVKEG